MQWPGHKYLGPGNTVRSQSPETPVDNDDRIAFQHDIEYELAQNAADIHTADLEAILAFLDDWTSTGNYHSLAGAWGIGIKYGLESFYHFYPQMTGPRPTHAGQRRYAEQQRAISARRATDTPGQRQKSWQDYVREYHRTSTRTPARVDATTAHIDNSQTAPSTSAGGSGSERVPDSLFIPGFEHHRSDTGASAQIESPSSSSDFASIGSLDQYLSGGWAGGMEGSMDVDPEQVASTSTSGGGAGRDASLGAGATAMIKLYRPMRPGTMSMTYTKSWVFYSYGYAFTQLKSATTKMTAFCTPLSYVPVDQASFYMSPAEFQALPVGAHARACSATVRLLGVRTAFDTGSTLSGVANTEQTHIAAYGIGLNKLGHAFNYKYTAETAKPMVPTGTESLKLKDDYIDRFYNSAVDVPMITGVARSNPGYLIHWYPSENFSNGCIPLNMHLNRFHVGSHLGQQVCAYNYKFRHAPISDTKLHDTLISPTSKDFNVTGRLDILPATVTGSQEKDGLAALNNATAQPRVVNNNLLYCGRKFLYTEPLEKAGFDTAINQTPHAAHAQPLLHIGLFPTPKLNPADERTDFQNSAIYYEVTATLHVDMDTNSVYPYGAPHADQHHVRFYTLGAFAHTMHWGTTLGMVNQEPAAAATTTLRCGDQYAHSDPSLAPTAVAYKRTRLARRLQRSEFQRALDLQQAADDDLVGEATPPHTPPPAGVGVARRA